MISVVVPVYNVEQYLERCVRSILDQSYTNFELILIDDGSTDNCPLLCDEFANRDNRIKVIHKTNGGLSDARNVGVQASKGEYIGFVDADDWIAPEMYEKLLASIRSEKSDIAACTVEMVWEDKDDSKLLTVKKNTVLDQFQAQRALLLETDLKQPVWYKLYKKDIIAGIPFEKGKTHEDVYWSYQVVGNANRISLIDYVGYYYFQRAGSIMGAEYSLRRYDIFDAYLKRATYIMRKYPELAAHVRIVYREACIYHGQMIELHFKGMERKNARRILCEYSSQIDLKKDDMHILNFTHKFWVMLSFISFTGTCKLKNVLKVGL